MLVRALSLTQPIPVRVKESTQTRWRRSDQAPFGRPLPRRGILRSVIRSSPLAPRGLAHLKKVQVRCFKPGPTQYRSTPAPRHSAGSAARGTTSSTCRRPSRSAEIFDLVREHEFAPATRRSWALCRSEERARWSGGADTSVHSSQRRFSRVARERRSEDFWRQESASMSMVWQCWAKRSTRAPRQEASLKTVPHCL